MMLMKVTRNQKYMVLVWSLVLMLLCPATSQETREKKIITILKFREEARLKEAMKEFTFLREGTYSCGGITQTVKEYRHEQTGMEFVLVPGGTFAMGDNDFDWAKPSRQVTLSPYLISKTEVTQGVWKKIMGNNPSKFQKGDNYPVEKVSWHEAHEFCQKTGLSLPTEAQWEYAARGGSTTKWYHGDNRDQLKEYAWYISNSENETHPVGQKKPNAYGLYDMAGNVWEWVQDWHARYYPSYTESDPKGPNSGLNRVNRGGAWCYDTVDCRPISRAYYNPDFRYQDLGFRFCANFHK